MTTSFELHPSRMTRLGALTFSGWLLSAYVFTVGDYFSLCVMQPGKNPALVDTFMQQLAGEGVSCRIASEGRYEMPDCEI